MASAQSFSRATVLVDKTVSGRIGRVAPKCTARGPVATFAGTSAAPKGAFQPSQERLSTHRAIVSDASPTLRHSQQQRWRAGGQRKRSQFALSAAPADGESKTAEEDDEDGSKKEKLILFGVTCPDNRAIQFTILTVGSLVCSIGFSALQEMVTRVPGFKFSGWMTLITTLAYALCALIEMVATKGKIEKKASWGNYVLLSTLTFGGMYATNYALKFLNYATRIVAKSSKVIPVMLFSTIINGKKYNWKEWGAVFLLVVGITLFTLGDVASMPAFNPIGIVLITASLCIDAVTSNFEEKVFFRVKTPSSHSEVLLFASLFGSVWSLASCWLTGELTPAIAHSMQYPQVVPSICVFSVLGYASVSFILGMIKFFGATEAEIVKSCRKVLSIVISFVLFPKALNWKYIAGFVTVVGSIGWTFQLKQEKIAAKKAAKEAAK